MFMQRFPETFRAQELFYIKPVWLFVTCREIPLLHIWSNLLILWTGIALGCRFYNALSCRLHTSGTYFFTVTCDPWKQELIIRYRLWRSHALLNVRAEWQFDVSAASCFRLHVEHLPFTLTFGPPLLVGPPFPITGVWNGAPGPLKPTSGWTQSPSNWIPRRKWLAVTAWAVDTAAWMRRAMTSPSSPPRPPSFASRRPSQ